MAEAVKRLRINEDTKANYTAAVAQTRLSGELAHIKDESQIALGNGTDNIDELKRLLLFAADKAAGILAGLEAAADLSGTNPVATIDDLPDASPAVTVINGGDATTPAV